eukprot:scaffold323555_cov14-Tisochrysis_lutea.AAC.1
MDTAITWSRTQPSQSHHTRPSLTAITWPHRLPGFREPSTAIAWSQSQPPLHHHTQPPPGVTHWPQVRRALWPEVRRALWPQVRRALWPQVRRALCGIARTSRVRRRLRSSSCSTKWPRFNILI